jgi:hypothetical protein
MSRQEVRHVSRQVFSKGVRGILRSCKSAFWDHSVKYGNLDCGQKIEFKFLADSGFLCVESPVTAAMLLQDYRSSIYYEDAFRFF